MANIKDEYDDQIMHDSRNHLGASECLKKVKDEEAWNFKVIMMRDLVLIIITIIIMIITTFVSFVSSTKWFLSSLIMVLIAGVGGQ